MPTKGRRRGPRRAQRPADAPAPAPSRAGGAAEQTLDDTDSSWGEQPEHERRRRWLQEQRPPHWE
ncbi:MAG: hypothetical protein U0Q08_00980 [Dermatophilaceae bacterium]